MEPKIKLKNVSFAAQCTKASEEVAPHFVSDKIVKQIKGKAKADTITSKLLLIKYFILKISSIKHQ